MKTQSFVTLPDHCVIAIYDDLAGAERGLRLLAEHGFGADRVSLVMRHLPPDHKTYEGLKMGDDSLRDAAIGGSLGALAGIVGATALVPVAGAALLLLTGPLAATGAVVGALVGAMRGWGVHDKKVEDYERLVHLGKVLLVVTGETPDVERAKPLLKQTAARQVNEHARAADESPEVDDRPLKGRV